MDKLTNQNERTWVNFTTKSPSVSRENSPSVVCHPWWGRNAREEALGAWGTTSWEDEEVGKFSDFDAIAQASFYSLPSRVPLIHETILMGLPKPTN